MSVPPSTTASRGDLVLQPAYFTSSLFVDPLRADIQHLIDVCAHYLGTQQTEQKFALFKQVWERLGWPWMHFKVFDARSRDVFLRVVMRLFLERTRETEAPLSRVVALFGLYTFYFTQPDSSAPPLHQLKHVEIPIDHYEFLLSLPASLTEPPLNAMQSHATYVLSCLLDAHVFYILPHSSLHPMNPRELPREIYVPDGSDPPPQAAGGSVPKKKGRPSKRDKAKKASDALAGLERMLDKHPSDPAVGGMLPSTSSAAGTQAPQDATRAAYLARKSDLLDAGARERTDFGDLIDDAGRAVMDVVASGAEAGNSASARLERALAERDPEKGVSGVFALVEGARRDKKSSPSATG